MILNFVKRLKIKHNLNNKKIPHELRAKFFYGFYLDENDKRILTEVEPNWVQLHKYLTVKKIKREIHEKRKKEFNEHLRKQGKSNFSIFFAKLMFFFKTKIMNFFINRIF